MVRFVYLSDQIVEGIREFAFYNTTIDRFMEFSGCQTWQSVEDFIKDYDGNELQRFVRLMNLDEENNLTQENLCIWHFPKNGELPKDSGNGFNLSEEVLVVEPDVRYIGRYDFDSKDTNQWANVVKWCYLPL